MRATAIIFSMVQPREYPTFGPAEVVRDGDRHRRRERHIFSVPAPRQQRTANCWWRQDKACQGKRKASAAALPITPCCQQSRPPPSPPKQGSAPDTIAHRESVDALANLGHRAGHLQAEDGRGAGRRRVGALPLVRVSPTARRR